MDQDNNKQMRCILCFLKTKKREQKIIDVSPIGHSFRRFNELINYRASMMSSISDREKAGDSPFSNFEMTRLAASMACSFVIKGLLPSRAGTDSWCMNTVSFLVILYPQPCPTG